MKIKEADAKPIFSEDFKKAASSILRGAAPQAPQDCEPQVFFDFLEDQGVAPLFYLYLRDFPHRGAWFASLQELLAEEVRYQTITQSLRRLELQKTLSLLRSHGIDFLLMKGVPLSYLLYPSPVIRPSVDVDLLICDGDVEIVKILMAREGYRLFDSIKDDVIAGEFCFLKEDEHGVNHVFDFHWKTSKPLVFSSVFSFLELKEASIPVEALGPGVRTLSYAHAMLLACVHRVAHHHDDDRLIWLYDIHLLAELLGASGLRAFSELAATKKMALVCHRGLSLTAQRFGTTVSEEMLAYLREAGSREALSEPYLRTKNSLRRDFISNLEILPLRKKIRFLRQCLFPPADYMMRKYASSNQFLLPFFYLRRGFSGIRKLL